MNILLVNESILYLVCYSDFFKKLRSDYSRMLAGEVRAMKVAGEIDVLKVQHISYIEIH